MLNTLITSKTRIKLLTKFFVNASNSGYLRGLAKEFGESTNAIRKELNKLTKARYLVLIDDKSHKKYYKANQDHPLFSAVHNIVLKQLGLDSLVESILERMGNIKRIIVVGDYAQGIDSGEIEVMVVGANLNTKYIKSLSKKIEKEIGRKVNFLVTQEYNGDGLILYDIEDETAK
ncbi:ArsR family transcriptional regulator [Flavobacteriaceae bacterium AH-315-B10]|nr:ArsR family transcriptional regulator [Flavobacteriaceae bacterium AH-315-B10]